MEVFEQSKTDNTKESIARKKKILAQFKRYHGGDNLHFAADADIDFDNMGPIELKNRYRNFAARAYDCLKWVITIVTPKRIQAELDTLKDKDTGAATTEAPKNIKSQFSKPSLNKYFAAYLRADRLANYYARSHRSTFVLIYLLGAAALITAACALAFKGEKTVLIFTGEEAVLICILLELVFLATICCLYLQDHRWKYHDRWLEYRCLAEFFRPMCYLSLLGRPYTISSFRDTAEYLDRKIIGHSAIGRSWLYIYTESINRWAGFNTCRLDSHCRQSVNHFITTTWLNGQINYHTHNAAVMRVLGKNLGQLSFGLFITTVICVILKLITVGIDLVIGSETAPDFITYLLALGAAILPILATTAYAIRNHAEFDISAQRSLTMRAALIFRRKKLNVNQTTLTSSQMTDILDEIATITIKETADWLEIYEVKESELG